MQIYWVHTVHGFNMGPTNRYSYRPEYEGITAQQGQGQGKRSGNDCRALAGPELAFGFDFHAGLSGGLGWGVGEGKCMCEGRVGWSRRGGAGS